MYIYRSIETKRSKESREQEFMKKVAVPVVLGALLGAAFYASFAQDAKDQEVAKVENASNNTGGKLAPKADYDDIARVFAAALPLKHISHDPLENAKAENAFENLFKALDYDHSLFYQEEIDRFAERAAQLDDELKGGELEFAYEVFEIFRDHLRDRVAYVSTLLEKGFDTTVEEEYTWKRKDEPWPKNAAERDELWRKKIKHEYVTRLVGKEMRRIEAEEEAAEAKKTGDADEEKTDPKERSVAEINEEQAEALAKEKRDRDNKLSPEQWITKKYTQYLNVIEGYDAEWVLQTYLDSFAHAYDIHTSFMAPRAIEDFNISMKLSLHGIGALLSYEDGAAEILKVIGGGPAERDGRLKPGDRIVAVQQDGEDPVDIMYWPLYKSVRLIRGEKGTTVILHVMPKSDTTGSNVVTIDLVRDKIKLEERAAKSRIKEFKGKGDAVPYRLGVIELPDFYADMGARRNGIAEPRSCATDVKRLLTELKADKIDGLVLDLRNNGGGSLPDCVELTGYFVEDGPIVQVKQGNRRPRPLLDPNRDVLYSGPMVVLVNRHSASASEILAAALQDYGRAIIVGDSKTHGKGSVQTLFPLDHGNSKYGSLKVTTAGFFRIDGRSTQLKGVNPDIVIPSVLDAMEIGEEYLDNVLPWEMVSAARYQPAGDLDDMINDLADRSEARREASKEFDALNDVINRLKEKLENTQISLNLAERIKLAKVDKELENMQKKLTGDDLEDQEKKDANDLVLGEGLHILRDMIAKRSQI